MIRPLKIAHISDLHLSPEHRRRNIRSTRQLLDKIATFGVDHLVITGDITADAEKGDFQLARKLLKQSGWLNAKALSVVIGNHDIFGGVNHAEDIFTFPKKCKQTHFRKKVTEFFEFFHELFEGTVQPDQSMAFPFGKAIGEIAFIGMNSVAEYTKLGNPIGSNGEVRREELKKCKEMLILPTFANHKKIVLIHHHFYKHINATTGAVNSLWNSIESQTMKLYGKKRLIKMFGETGVELVLHGHAHENLQYYRNNIRFINGGGSIRPHDEASRFNLITLNEKEITVEEMIITSGRDRTVSLVVSSSLVRLTAGNFSP